MTWNTEGWWNYIVSFDVESWGLHGPGFAVGAVVFKEGVEVETFYARYPDPQMWGIISQGDIDWVRQNVIPHLDPPTHDRRQAMREAFWLWWQQHQAAGAVLVSDVPWPVEANFLSAHVTDERGIGTPKWPYPLIDVASILAATGCDPLERVARKADELPAHNPVKDARQSGRQLLSALGSLRDLREDARLHHASSAAL